MVLAFYVAYIPHSNYPYPVHIDEWFHMALSNQVIKQAAAMGLTDPFSGGAAIWNQSVELGFHLFSTNLHQISGVAWLDIVKYFPGIIFIITVLSVYVLAKRQGFGWQAAFFTCLVPTTVGILGPAFFVPVALGLPFIPLAIFLALNLRGVSSYVVLFIFTNFLVSSHGATAVVIVLILAPFILLNLRSNPKHSLGMTLALVIPFITPFPWIFHMLLPAFKSLFSVTPVTWYVDIPSVIQTYGYLPALFCSLGTFVLAMRGSKKDYGLILGFLALLVMLITFYIFHHGLATLYERGLVYAMLLMSIVAGAGLMFVTNLKLPASLSVRLRVPLTIRNIGKILGLAIIILTLCINIPNLHHIPYYHMIDDQDYEAFVWIKDNLSKGYEKAILDPWKATAFTAITEKRVYARIHTNPTPIDLKVYDFLYGGSNNTTFLRENGISIVYDEVKCSNPDLVEVRKNVYLLREARQDK
jgi:hypothetical protein